MYILVAENDARVLSALTMLLKCVPGFVVVGRSQELESLRTQIRALEPDLILLDWELPGLPHQDIREILGDSGILPKVVVLGKRPELEAQAITAGADAFVSKTDPPDLLLETLYRIAGTRSPCPSVPSEDKCRTDQSQMEVSSK